MKHLTKLLLFALAVFAVFALASCDDKHKDPEPRDKLLGKWKVNSIEVQAMVDGKSFKDYLVGIGYPEDLAAEIDSTFTSENTFTDVDAVMEFKADGTWTGTSSDPTDNATGKWTLSADQKTLSISEDDQPGVTENTILVTLTDTDLVFQMKGVFDDTFPLEFTETLNLKKI
jgi:hypothetical protein